MRSVRKAISKRVRFRVLLRCEFRCVYCGALAGDVVLVIDHLIPVAKGGGNDESNLVAACDDCNQGKSYDMISGSSPTNGVRPVIDVSANCCEVVETGVFYQGEYYEFVDVEANYLMSHPDS